MAHEFLIEERELVKPGIQYNDLVCAVYAWREYACTLFFFWWLMNLAI
jgi:hypothetical protein